MPANGTSANGMIRPDGTVEGDTIENHVDAKTVPREVRAWTINPRFGEMIPADVDTLFLNFQNSNETSGMNGEYNMLGNMGSPRLSRLFMNRLQTSESFFLDPYDFFVRRPDNIQFYDTKSPFTNLSYWACGDKTVGDDRFKALFTVNGNKRLNVGFILDYLYGRGYYMNQATAFFNGLLFGSYRGEKYQMHLMFSANHMKMAENGGIEDDNFITHPEDLTQSITSSTIPTILEKSWNRNDNQTLYFTHRYNVGFHRVLADTTAQDSVPRTEFVPVTSFIHTLQVDQNHRQYLAYTTPENYYAQTFLPMPGDSTFDDTKYFAIKNTVAISLKEGFNKWAQAGLTAFARYNMRRYDLLDLRDESSITTRRFSENILSIGGELTRTQGKRLNYRILGETSLTGEDAGDFNLDGRVDLKFRLLGDTIHLAGRAYVKNQTPNFYFRHYHAHHFWWDNDLDKEMRTRLEGEFSLKRTQTTLRVSVENLKNYTFLKDASTALTDNEGNVISYANNVAVGQESGNIQVLTAQLKQNFRLGILHWDNELTWQKCSNEDILPLPKLNLYSNLYLKFHLVKNVLRMQIGADVRYFSEYYAPDYSPGLGQFYLQNPETRVKIGNYPFVNTYINAEWKRTRIYAMVFCHVNEGMGSRNYFLAPHYPVNPQVFKLGISWNFYD